MKIILIALLFFMLLVFVGGINQQFIFSDKPSDSNYYCRCINGIDCDKYTCFKNYLYLYAAISGEFLKTACNGLLAFLKIVSSPAVLVAQFTLTHIPLQIVLMSILIAPFIFPFSRIPFTSLTVPIVLLYVCLYDNSYFT